MRTLGVTAAGVAACVAVAFAVALVIPVEVNTATNSEVLARTSPRLVDLVVAFAAGLIAAVALVRDDIPDAVPGYSDYRLRGLTFDETALSVEVAGQGPVPSMDDLARLLEERGVGARDVRVAVVPEYRMTLATPDQAAS